MHSLVRQYGTVVHQYSSSTAAPLYLQSYRTTAVRPHRCYSSSTSTSVLILDLSTRTTDVHVEAIDSTNTQASSVDRDGNPVVQEGDVVFSVQQGVDLRAQNVRIFAYGPDNIKKLTGIDVSVSNVDVTLNQISTTTT